ncbi:MAG: AAA family ATPase [Bacillota bacterium]
MFVMFRAKNYTSFKEDVIIDMRKGTYREHPHHIINGETHDVLKSLAIYGPNASGKSNLISAIATFDEIVRNNFFDNDKEELPNKKISTRLKSFLLSKDPDDVIEFEMIFYNEYLFQYGFSIKNNEILTEWLEVNEELVFDREKTNLKFGEKYYEQLNELSKNRLDRLYISVLDYFISENPLKDIVEKFKFFFINKLNLYSEIIIETTIKGLNVGIGPSKRLREDEQFRKKVVKYIQKVDLGIDDIIIEEEIINKPEFDQEEKISVLKTVHNIYNKNNEIVDSKKFKLQYESSGTIRFLSFIQQVLEIMENGGVFIVDEMSSRLHPVLAKFIVDMFVSKDNHKGQLIFVTHDISLMNKDQFRRDEVGLVDKNKKGESKFYTLYDLEVRSDASFDKDYFKGKYGAIPIIDSYNVLNN